MFENQQLAAVDILLIFPTTLEVDEVPEFLDEDDVDYTSLMSVYIYSRLDAGEVFRADSWIFSIELKYATFVHSDWLPDQFFNLSISAVEIEFDGSGGK